MITQLYIQLLQLLLWVSQIIFEHLILFILWIKQLIYIVTVSACFFLIPSILGFLFIYYFFYDLKNILKGLALGTEYDTLRHRIFLHILFYSMLTFCIFFIIYKNIDYNDYYYVRDHLSKNTRVFYALTDLFLQYQIRGLAAGFVLILVFFLTSIFGYSLLILNLEPIFEFLEIYLTFCLVSVHLYVIGLVCEKFWVLFKLFLKMVKKRL